MQALNRRPLNQRQATRLNSLARFIYKNCIHFRHEGADIRSRRTGKPAKILFDLRPLFLDPMSLDHLAEIFLDRFDRTPLQVAGLESAALPFLGALALRARRSSRDFNAITIRKRPKEYGLRNQIEGLPKTVPTIIVDDLINSGTSLKQGIEALKNQSIETTAAFVVLDFEQARIKTWLPNTGFEFVSLFVRNDFLQFTPD